MPTRHCRSFNSAKISSAYAARSPLPAPPYVYSLDELQRLFGSINISRQWPVQLDAGILRALVLLLYGAGLRFANGRRKPRCSTGHSRSRASRHLGSQTGSSEPGSRCITKRMPEDIVRLTGTEEAIVGAERRPDQVSGCELASLPIL